MNHGDHDSARASYEIHRPAHSRNDLTWNHPISEVTLLVDFEAAKHSHIKTASADEPKTHRAINRGRARHGSDKTAARIRQVKSLHSFGGRGPKPITPFSA